MKVMVAVEDYAAARNKYKPEKVRVLWIAESPPFSQGFFYFDTTVGYDFLFKETMKAIGIWKPHAKMGKNFDKRDLLEQFQSMGYFLIDASLSPVNQLPKPERKLAIIRRIPGLVEDVRQLNPKAIVVVKKTIFGPVRDGLQKAGLGDRILNGGPLRFPSHGWQKDYREKLRKLLKMNGLLP